LKRKYKNAIDGQETSHKVFVGVDSAITEDLRTQWKEQEDKARQNRGDDLKIYEVQMHKGKFW
jgi:hypothetical protein